MVQDDNSHLKHMLYNWKDNVDIFEKNILFYENQFGLINHLSSIKFAIKLINKLTENLEQGKNCG